MSARPWSEVRAEVEARAACGMSTEAVVEADEYLLPAEDACAYSYCGRPAAEHDEIFHRFLAPPQRVRPEVCVESHITTEWTCWNCGADNDVWGVGEGFIECPECGKDAYLR